MGSLGRETSPLKALKKHCHGLQIYVQVYLNEMINVTRNKSKTQNSRSYRKIDCLKVQSILGYPNLFVSEGVQISKIT